MAARRPVHRVTMDDAINTLRVMFSGIDDSVLKMALQQASPCSLVLLLNFLSWGADKFTNAYKPTIDWRMEQAVEILLRYSPANTPSAPSLPVASSPPRPVDAANRIEQIDLTIASLTSQKIDCVQREQYSKAQGQVLKIIQEFPTLVFKLRVMTLLDHTT